MTTLLPQGQRKSTEGLLDRLKNTMGIRSGDRIPLMTEVIGVVQLMVMMSGHHHHQRMTRNLGDAADHHQSLHDLGLGRRRLPAAADGPPVDM
jgi:hypothetical protein